MVQLLKCENLLLSLVLIYSKLNIFWFWMKLCETVMDIFYYFLTFYGPNNFFFLELSK